MKTSKWATLDLNGGKSTHIGYTQLNPVLEKTQFHKKYVFL